MSEQEKARKEDIQDFAMMPFDLEDGAQLPHLMGWAMHDYQLERARRMEEIAEELGAQYFPRRFRGSRPLRKKF
ncbi:MAG: hypothetical protein ACOYCE_01810 [Limnochordia bacterium]|jgi:hypothetical protein|nr:hypothetical protein [Bacillota bacterium]